MPYKRFSRVAWAFSIPQNHAVFVDVDFFNTHACWQQLIFRSWHFTEPYAASRYKFWVAG
jgi:hypothetical protein